MNNFNSKLHTYYFQVVDLWNRLCEEHTMLFEATCTEYVELLENNIEKLESSIKEKEKIIYRINSLDNLRSKIIKNIEAETNHKIENIKDLISLMDEFEKNNNQKHLWRFNQILIDIIEKIQTQNKKNQMFINKASLALQEIKDEVLGQKTYSTYTNKGIKRNKSTDKIIVEKNVGDK
jgi:FlgN protein